MSPKGLVHILTVEEIDGELQALSNQGGEEEETGRYNLKHQQPPSHVDPGVANSAVLVAVLVGCVLILRAPGVPRSCQMDGYATSTLKGS